MIGNGLRHDQMQELWADGNDSGANWALSLFEDVAREVESYLADPGDASVDENKEKRAELLLRDFLLVYQKHKIYSLQRALGKKVVIGKEGEEM